MKLSHYTTEPLGEIRDISQPKQNSAFTKPRGLWVSVDGEHDWPSWCEAEDYRIGQQSYAVTLAANANILHVSRDLGIHAFQRRFGIRTDYGDYRINWEQVAASYDGIIITPYHWTVRLSMNWYYGWDCASGCIWRSKAIQSVKLVDL